LPRISQSSPWNYCFLSNPTSHPSISINNSPITEKLNSMMSQMLILSLDGCRRKSGVRKKRAFIFSPAHKFWNTLSLSFPSRYSLPIWNLFGLCGMTLETKSKSY
jgi:hypothetical protein